MSLLDVIAMQLSARFQDLDLVRDPDRFDIPPSGPQGFAISCFKTPAGVVVYFDGWHEEFTDAETAVRCIAFGLSDRCRLEVHRKGAFEFKWSLQSRDDDGTWQEDSPVGLLLLPFWRNTSIEIRTNSPSTMGIDFG